VQQRDLAIHDGHLFERYLAGADAHSGARGPVHAAVVRKRQNGARANEAHVEDVDLAAHVGREFGIHGKGLDRHRGHVRALAGDADVGESHGGERQQARVRPTLHRHLAA
jgi:hypothetical protein